MSTIQFEYDPERLIEEVHKRPGIWDFDDVQYRAKKVRHKLWREVVNELMQSDVKVTKSEMRELELQLQKKWKSIRDCFQKYLRDPNRTKRPYVYSKQLQFLLKNQTMQPAEPNPSSDSDTGREKKTIWKTKKKLKFLKSNQETSDEDMEHEMDTFDTQDDCITTEVLETDEIAKSSNSKLLDDFAFASVDNIPKNEPEDPDKLFLLSLLPHLKSIPEEYRLNVKVDLMQVLRNANYQAGQNMKIV